MENKLEELKQRIQELKEQLESFIKDYKTFSTLTNETITNIMQFFMQYAALIEGIYSALIREGIIEKRLIDELAEQIYKEFIDNIVNTAQNRAKGMTKD